MDKKFTSTNLKEISNDDISALQNKPINIRDAASMLRKKIAPNDPPYTQDVVRMNNELVDEWYDRVLVKMADKYAEVPPGRVWRSWITFFEGKELYKYQNYLLNLPAITPEMVEYWSNFFKRTTKELKTEGVIVVTLGWQTLTAAIKGNIAQEKWEKIYSSTKDPWTWEKEANKYPYLFNKESLAFGLDYEEFKGMEEKVFAIGRNMVQPTN